MLRQRGRGSEEDWPPPPSEGELKPSYCELRLLSLPPLCSVLAFLFLGGTLWAVASYMNNRLPAMLTIADEASNNGRFIGERAMRHLHRLSGLGPKVTGSYENEVLAVDLLTREISTIMRQASPAHRISFDLQKPTGAFNMLFRAPFQPFMSYYANIQNVAVKLGPQTNGSVSLLVNCHFDSVPSSPGASDDGLNCAVMLEVMRVLSQQTMPLPQNVIFLFNGAEENPLQGSHGFITQHKWAPEVRAFVNLESCGAGGREVLFQSGPNHPWLIQLYGEAVPHPSGLVLAEDIFQGGLVPSDTDFRIFRDFGHIPGVDFAHCANGYVYHTALDTTAQIDDGVYQHTGDNLLALVRRYLTAKQLIQPTERHSTGRAVYFDLAGLAFVNYSQTAGTVLNFSTVLIAIFTALQSAFVFCAGLKRNEVCDQLAYSAVVPGLGFLVAVVTVTAIALLLDATNSALSWYAQPGWIVPLYCLPTFVAMALPIVAVTRLRKNSFCQGVQVQMYCNGVQLLWSLVLFILAMTSVRSVYLVMLVVLVPSIASLALLLLLAQPKVSVWLVCYMASACLPVLYVVYVTVQALQLFVPITGRLGSTMNPELLIGILTSLLCILSASYIIPVILLVRKPWHVLGGLALVSVVAIAGVVVTPLGFPYTEQTPQRIMVYHIERSFHDLSGSVHRTEAGFWLDSMDRRGLSATATVVPLIAMAESLQDDCKALLNCGLPLYRATSMAGQGHWIPASPPVIQQPTHIELVSKAFIASDTQRLTFNISGPNHMNIFLCPMQDVALVNWSFPGVAQVATQWKGRPVYYVRYLHGLSGPPWSFHIDLKTGEMWAIGAALLDVHVGGHYLHEDVRGRTPQFTQLINSFPAWAHVTAWIAVLDAHIY